MTPPAPARLRGNRLLVALLLAVTACGAPADQTARLPGPSVSRTHRATSTAFRFVVASDGHLGERGTDSTANLRAFVDAVNTLDRALPLTFVVVNGDIVEGARHLGEAKAGLDRLSVPYLAVAGNHDRATDAQWFATWRTRPDLVQRFGERSVVVATTSNRAGDYLCADAHWLGETLDRERAQRDVFVFFHITPRTWTRFGVDCPAVTSVLSRHPNVRAVFNGHDHDQTGMKTWDDVPYLFDAHYGGHWGTPFRAYRVVEVDESGLSTHLVRIPDGSALRTQTLTWP